MNASLKHMLFGKKTTLPAEYELFNYTFFKIASNRSLQCCLFYKSILTVSYPCSTASKGNFMMKNVCEKDFPLIGD